MKKPEYLYMYKEIHTNDFMLRVEAFRQRFSTAFMEHWYFKQQEGIKLYD